MNLIFLAAAFAFFARLSFQRLYPEAVPKRSRAFSALIVASCAGLGGAWLYGLVGLANTSAPAGLPASAVEFPFGSFGGYWGVIFGSLVASALLRSSYLRQADAFVPGILAGGALARLADLFTNASPGIHIELSHLPTFQPFEPWAIYDISIHLLTLFLLGRLVRRYGPIPGLALAVFLVGYGSLRWIIEFVRVAPYMFGPFTYGHVMAFLQLLAGAGLALRLWRGGLHRRR